MPTAHASNGGRSLPVASETTTTSNYSRLKGMNTLVTGATSGIGKAVATAMSREGARLVLTGRKEEPGHGRQVSSHIVDMDMADAGEVLHSNLLSERKRCTPPPRAA